MKKKFSSCRKYKNKILKQSNNSLKCKKILKNKYHKIKLKKIKILQIKNKKNSNNNNTKVVKF